MSAATKKRVNPKAASRRTPVRKFAQPLAQATAGHVVQRLLGFWVMWHVAGGLEELIAQNWIARSGVYTQRAEFRRVFGVDVDLFLPPEAAALAARRQSP